MRWGLRQLIPKIFRKRREPARALSLEEQLAAIRDEKEWRESYLGSQRENAQNWERLVYLSQRESHLLQQLGEQEPIIQPEQEVVSRDAFFFWRGKQVLYEAIIKPVLETVHIREPPAQEQAYTPEQKEKPAAQTRFLTADKTYGIDVPEITTAERVRVQQNILPTHKKGKNLAAQVEAAGARIRPLTREDHDFLENYNQGIVPPEKTPLLSWQPLPEVLAATRARAKQLVDKSKAVYASTEVNWRRVTSYGAAMFLVGVCASPTGDDTKDLHDPVVNNVDLKVYEQVVPPPLPEVEEQVLEELVEQQEVKKQTSFHMPQALAGNEYLIRIIHPEEDMTLAVKPEGDEVATRVPLQATKRKGVYKAVLPGTLKRGLGWMRIEGGEHLASVSGNLDIYLPRVDVVEPLEEVAAQAVPEQLVPEDQRTVYERMGVQLEAQENTFQFYQREDSFVAKQGVTDAILTMNGEQYSLRIKEGRVNVPEEVIVYAAFQPGLEVELLLREDRVWQSRKGTLEEFVSIGDMPPEQLKKISKSYDPELLRPAYDGPEAAMDAMIKLYEQRYNDPDGCDMSVSSIISHVNDVYGTEFTHDDLVDNLTLEHNVRRREYLALHRKKRGEMIVDCLVNQDMTVAETAAYSGWSERTIRRDIARMDFA
jgi:hypothetical protein